MLLILILVVSFYLPDVCRAGNCPNEKAFLENGWIVHAGEDFDHILSEKLKEFLPELGGDLVVDFQESYISDFSHDEFMIMWIVILDRLSTDRDEMWGDVAISSTGPCSNQYTEIRWYDPVARKKHIVCNPDYSCCLTTKVPLAYNTIF
jgi:hypothetical protein